MPKTAPVRRKKPRLPVISLFSGAMGLDLGLERAGFEVAVAVECNPCAVATIKLNRPDLPIIDRPIEEVSTKEILDAAGLKPGEPMLLAGGPSCQVFSTAGGRRSLDDPRGALFEHFVRVVREARPRFFVMENVRGLLSAAVRHRTLEERGPGYPRLTKNEELGSALKVVADELRGLGYYVVFDELNAADFGVPQARHRLVFIGSRNGEAVGMPSVTHTEIPRKGIRKWRTLDDAIGALKEKKPEYYEFCPSKARYLKRVPSGGNWRDLPSHLRRKALGSAFDSWGGRSGFFRRLNWKKPSPALTTRPDSKATMLCHPTRLRPLTVGEYMRIQQFPKSWKLSGMVRQKYEQIGNAVPLGLGEAIGRSLRKTMRSKKRKMPKGEVVCWNLDLLEKMCRRPRTIVNPPRMRKSAKTKALTDWLTTSPRKRRDGIDYVPVELLAELERRVGLSLRESKARTERVGKPSRRASRRRPLGRRTAAMGRMIAAE